MNDAAERLEDEIHKALEYVKCDPANLAATLQERMKAEGRTNAEIQDVLGNNLKRKALGSRVAKASGCTSDQVNSALRTLETTTKG